MKFVTLTLAGAFLFTSLGATNTSTAAETLRIAEGSVGAPLTLTGAKQTVSRLLNESGQIHLRVGRAEFDRDGNVAVEIVSLQGVPMRHVVVDAKSGVVADARTGAPLKRS